MVRTIDDVIERLTDIVEWAKEEGSRIGYYAALYRIVTVKIKEAIVSREFENNQIIKDLDIIFAGYYISAFEQYRSTGRCNECWKLAFDLSTDPRLTILQHLVVSINVHINYDLCLALVEITKNSKMEPLKGDFNRINDILHSLTDDIAKKIAVIWNRTGFLDNLVGKIDKMIINFMMRLSRRNAWKVANRLHKLHGEEKYWIELDKLDRRVANFSNVVIKAQVLANMPFWFRKKQEKDSIAEIITKLE